MRWFPDRRGLATGLGLTAFGAGAALAAPVIQYMLAANFVAPDYLGTVADVAITLDSSGKMLAETGAGVQEVVVATTADLKGVPGDLAEGVYVAGTGSTGASTAFLTLAGAYGASMLVGAAGNRTPHPDWKPAGWTPPSEDSAMIAKNDVDHVTALKTPQFYLLWTAVMGNAVAGMTLLSAAKTTMGDVFGAALPAVVTGAFTTKCAPCFRWPIPTALSQPEFSPCNPQVRCGTVERQLGRAIGLVGLFGLPGTQKHVLFIRSRHPHCSIHPSYDLVFLGKPVNHATLPLLRWHTRHDLLLRRAVLDAACVQ